MALFFSHVLYLHNIVYGDLLRQYLQMETNIYIIILITQFRAKII